MFPAAAAQYVPAYTAPHIPAFIFCVSTFKASRGSPGQKRPRTRKLILPSGHRRNAFCLKQHGPCSVTSPQSGPGAATLALLSLRPVSSVSPVVAVGAAAGQLQRRGGGAVPNHPRWGALHGRQPGSLQDLLCGGELREPERVPLRRSHRLQWFRYQVSQWFNTLTPFYLNGKPFKRSAAAFNVCVLLSLLFSSLWFDFYQWWCLFPPK